MSDEEPRLDALVLSPAWAATRRRSMRHGLGAAVVLLPVLVLVLADVWSSARTRLEFARGAPAALGCEGLHRSGLPPSVSWYLIEHRPEGELISGSGAALALWEPSGQCTVRVVEGRALTSLEAEAAGQRLWVEPLVAMLLLSFVLRWIAGVLAARRTLRRAESALRGEVVSVELISERPRHAWVREQPEAVVAGYRAAARSARVRKVRLDLGVGPLRRCARDARCVLAARTTDGELVLLRADLAPWVLV